MKEYDVTYLVGNEKRKCTVIADGIVSALSLVDLYNKAVENYNDVYDCKFVRNVKEVLFQTPSGANIKTWASYNNLMIM